MNTPELPHYTRFHPKWYRERIPIFWWVRRWVHTRFILRELTSVFVAYSALVMLIQVRAMGLGENAYAQFSVWLETPTALILNAIAFLFVAYHSVTWLRLAPRALVIRLGSRQVSDAAIVAGNFLALGVTSALVAWILLVHLK